MAHDIKKRSLIRIIKTRKGSKGKQYKVIVEMTDKIKFSRKYLTREEAQLALIELRKLLVENQGLVIPMLSKWQQQQGEISK